VGSAIASASSASSSRTGSARDSRRKRRDLLLEDRDLGVACGVDQRQAELHGQRFGHVTLRAQPQRHEQRAEALAAGILLKTQRAIERRGVELPAFDQDFAKAPPRRRVAGIHRNGAHERAPIIARPTEEMRVTFCPARNNPPSGDAPVAARRRATPRLSPAPDDSRADRPIPPRPDALDAPPKHLTPEGVREFPERRAWPGAGARLRANQRIAAKAAAAAATVAPMSSSACAEETKPASYADGAK
jgi:hypothetical protein